MYLLLIVLILITILIIVINIFKIIVYYFYIAYSNIINLKYLKESNKIAPHMRIIF